MLHLHDVVTSCQNVISLLILLVASFFRSWTTRGWMHVQNQITSLPPLELAFNSSSIPWMPSRRGRSQRDSQSSPKKGSDDTASWTGKTSWTISTGFVSVLLLMNHSSPSPTYKSLFPLYESLELPSSSSDSESSTSRPLPTSELAYDADSKNEGTCGPFLPSHHGQHEGSWCSGLWGSRISRDIAGWGK